MCQIVSIELSTYLSALYYKEKTIELQELRIKRFTGVKSKQGHI